MKTIVFAYHDFGCLGIEALQDAGFEITDVFTHTDSAHENVFFGSVARLAARKGLLVHAPEDVNHPLWVAYIKRQKPDFIFSFYFRNLLCQEILDSAARGAYNLHGSLLPRYRGRSPVNWVLVNGETETGVTLHTMVARADAGMTVGQEKVPISDDDTALTLHRKMCGAASALLKIALPKLADGSAKHLPQDLGAGSYFGRRTPADGLLDWQRSARELYNLVRAVTEPYPGAFTFAGESKLIVWKASVSDKDHNQAPGTVLSTDPLRIACGSGVLAIDAGQSDAGLYMRGAQLAQELHLVPGMRLASKRSSENLTRGKTKVLILGVNGFIGNHLTAKLVESQRYEVYGLDIGRDAISRLLEYPDFHFVEGDIGIHNEWIEYHVKKCDVVLPLVAIATPIEYTRSPLRVFELDFEQNLKIIRFCHRYQKRVIFPSTSEVYGMCLDPEFDEDRSQLVLGPINKQRWIYSSSKQLLDRVIWAYGQQEGLRFTLFRPFNWVGPRLDSLRAARIGSSRAITQLILNLVEGSAIKLIDGGEQKRCFTDIDDGIEALFRIIENPGGRCDGEIINIGNPENELSIRRLAELLVEKFAKHPLRGKFPPFAGFSFVESQSYYGAGYEDVTYRRPSIRKAKRLLNWEPCVSLDTTIDKTLDFFLASAAKAD